MSDGGITIRRSLIRTLVLIIVATAGVMLGVMIVQSTRAVEDLSRSLVHRSTTQVQGELRGFFDPVKAQLETMADWGRGGLLPIDPARLTPLMRPILRREAQVSSLLIAAPSGHGYMLLERADDFRAREVRPEEWGRTARWTQYSLDGALEREWSEEIGYDPRERPWFREAQAAGRGHIAWTEPYAFFTTGDPGITAATVFRSPEDGRQHVAGLDVLLSDISRFTTGLEVSEHGTALVVAEDGRVIGLPRDARFARHEARREAGLTPLAELGLPVAQAAWSETGRGDRITSIERDGERWWVGIRRFPLGEGRALWIEVLVPERDFLEQVERQRNIILVVVFIALVLAVLIALRLARGYSEPLETLVQRAERIRTLDLSPQPPLDSSLREVRQLTRAQERMRAALESFSRYVPLEVVRELIRQGDVARLGGRNTELSILFTDIEGFTSASEGMSPQEISEHVGVYFDAMLGILEEERATVDKLIGDAIMAFWGAPVDDPEHARRALEGVLRCQARLAELQLEWRDAGLPLLHTRFGLHTGPVMVGNIGSHQRLSYTVLGDSVNLTARLEGANKAYGTRVLATRSFKEAVGEGYVWRWLDRVAVKGRREAVDVFEPLGREGDVDEERIVFARAYEDAFARARERDFDAALERLASLGEEPSVALLRERCVAWRESPPDADWAGESRLGQK